MHALPTWKSMAVVATRLTVGRLPYRITWTLRKKLPISNVSEESCLNAGLAKLLYAGTFLRVASPRIKPTKALAQRTQSSMFDERSTLYVVRQGHGIQRCGLDRNSAANCRYHSPSKEGMLYGGSTGQTHLKHAG